MIYAFLEGFRCHEETDEVGDDEPYFIVTAIDLDSTVPVAGFPVPIPTSRAFRYGPFEDVSGPSSHFAPFMPFWGLFGEERALNPDRVIFIVSAMENDDGD